METRYLEEFVDLARTLNFTQTATSFHLTQPTLSKHISALERDLGVELFSRRPSEVSLTEEGFYFLGVATSITGQYEEARKALAVIKNRMPLRIDGRFEDPAITGLVSLVAAEAADRGLPPVVFNHNRQQSAPDLLTGGEIDVLIDLMPFADEFPDGVVGVPLLSRRILVVVTADHPLASCPSLSLADLREQTFVQLMASNYQPGWGKIERLCRTCGFEPARRPTPVYSMLEGVGSLDRSSVFLYPSSSKELKYLELGGRHRCIPLADPDAEFIVYAMYVKANEDRVASLVEALTAATSAMHL